MLKFFRLTGALVFVAGAITALGPAPAADAATGPMKTTSYYVKSTTSQNDLYNAACALANVVEDKTSAQDLVVILHFGAQSFSSTNGWQFSVFSSSPKTDTWVIGAVKSYSSGFYHCLDANTSSTVTVGLGTNNSGRVDTYAGMNLAGDAAAADDWAEANYGTEVEVVGANDIEPSFGDDNAMRAWVDGYSSYSGHRSMYDFGAMDGCSQSTTVPAWNSPCNNGWVIDDVWYGAWAGADYPLPQIYTTNGSQAQQWYNLARYSVASKSTMLRFQSVMTQALACAQRGGCSGTNNDPETGWDQLYDKLTANSATAGGASGMRKTDIGWQGE